EQHPVQADPTGVVVHLILVAAPLRDLDGHIEVHQVHPSWSGAESVPLITLGTSFLQQVRFDESERHDQTSQGGSGIAVVERRPARNRSLCRIRLRRGWWPRGRLGGGCSPRRLP